MTEEKLSQANYLQQQIRSEEKRLEEIMRAGFEASLLKDEENTLLCEGKQRFRYERIDIFISQDYIFEQIEQMEQKQRQELYELKQKFDKL